MTRRETKAYMRRWRKNRPPQTFGWSEREEFRLYIDRGLYRHHAAMATLAADILLTQRVMENEMERKNREIVAFDAGRQRARA